MAIPIIDFAQASVAPDAVAQNVLQACTEWGFFFIKNHPIPQASIDGIFDLETNFFAQSPEIKTSVPYDPKTNTGYIYKNIIEPYGKIADPRESFSIKKWPSSSHAAAAKLPPGLDSARAQIESFQKAMHSFSKELLELISIALKLPADSFTSSHNATSDNYDNFLLMHYPPVTSAELDEGVKFRISPHTDWGTITLLFQQKVGGLQVRPPVYTSAELDLDSELWTSAPVYDDMILINIGDMLEIWTAGRLKSTWHRVAPNSAEGNLGSIDRYTFAYFLHPDRDTKLIPYENLKREGWVPRYSGVGETAEEHVFARISQEKTILAETATAIKA